MVNVEYVNTESYAEAAETEPMLTQETFMRLIQHALMYLKVCAKNSFLYFCINKKCLIIQLIQKHKRTMKRIYIGSNDHNIYSLNASNRTLIWKYTTNDYVVLLQQ